MFLPILLLGRRSFGASLPFACLFAARLQVVHVFAIGYSVGAPFWFPCLFACLLAVLLPVVHVFALLVAL